MAQESATTCDICKKDLGKVFCYECRNFLCQMCISWHNKFPANKRHTVTDSHNVDRTTLMLTFVCEDHKLEFCYYCRKCKYLICTQCVTSVHNGHSIRDITEVASTAREDVQKRLGNIKENIETLSDWIDTFKTTKKTRLQTGTDNFIKEVNEMSQDMIRIIELVTENNLTYASDFLILEKQQLLYNLAKLKKSFSEYKSMHERHEVILKEKHDVTFFLKEKSLAKEFELIDAINFPEEPKEIKPFNRNRFVNSVIDKIECKYGERDPTPGSSPRRSKTPSVSTSHFSSSSSERDYKRKDTYRERHKESYSSGSKREYRYSEDRERERGRKRDRSSESYSSSHHGNDRDHRYKDRRYDRVRDRDRDRGSSSWARDCRYKDRRYDRDRDRDRDNYRSPTPCPPP